MAKRVRLSVALGKVDWLVKKPRTRGRTVEKRIANSDGRTDGADGIDGTDGIDGLIFQEHSIMGLSQPASQPAYSLAGI